MEAFPHDDLYFHGTLEPIEGELRQGPDGLLWFARSPAIAQSYIPKAGSSLLFSYPAGRERDRVEPSRNGSGWHAIARMMGCGEPQDMAWERHQLVSWRIPVGWPTYAEAVDWLQKEMGYSLTPGGSVWVSIDRGPTGEEHLKPANWKSPGKLFIAKARGLRFYSLDEEISSDLINPGHREYEKFGEIEQSNQWDGVRIDDFLQSDRHGNVPHKSFGVFARSLKKLSFFQIAATNHDWEAGELPGSEEGTLDWRNALHGDQAHELQEFLGLPAQVILRY